MKNTVITVTLGIDRERIMQQVCAESACIAVMSPGNGRPEILSGGNKKLLMVQTDLSLAGFCARFSAFIGGFDLLSVSSSDVVKLPMIVPADSRISSMALLRLVEQILSTSVLAACYVASADLSSTLFDRHESHCSRLLQLLLPPPPRS